MHSMNKGTQLTSFGIRLDTPGAEELLHGLLLRLVEEPRQPNPVEAAEPGAGLGGRDDGGVEGEVGREDVVLQNLFFPGEKSDLGGSGVVHLDQKKTFH